jgi:flagellar hook-associated protein 2
MKAKGLDASIEEVGKNEDRFVLKSSKQGLDNKISINENIKITAIELGKSTLSLQKDESSIIPELKTMAKNYNELVDSINKELYSEKTSIKDKSSLKLVLGKIKDILFSSYGKKDDLNIFAVGFSLDNKGHLKIDEKTLKAELSTNIDKLKELFIGVAEKPGLGTVLKEYVDNLDSLNGLLSKYGDNMVTRKTNLEKDKEEAQKMLDKKYKQMSLDFAAYTGVITRFENSFNGLRMMIKQSTSG